ncbi:MAG: MFS transporter [Polyangiaceae bacterium]
MAEPSTNPYEAPAAEAPAAKIDPAPGPAPSMMAALLPIFIIVLIDVLGLTLIIPILPTYAQRFGADDQTVGLLLTVFAICQFFASPVLGRLSDSFGRKPVLIVSQIGMLASYLVLGAAQHLWVIFLGRIIAGATAGNISIAQAYISDVTRPEQRTRAYGLIGIAFGLGFILGPPISGFLMDWRQSAPFYAAAILSALSATVTAILLPHREPKKQEGAPKKSRIGEIVELFARREPRRRLVEFFVFQMAFSMLMGGGFVLFLQHQFPEYFGVHLAAGGKHIGFMFLYTGIIGSIVQGGFVGRLARKFGEEKLALIGFVCGTIGHVAMGLTRGALWQLLLMMVVGQFGFGVVRPALTTLLTKAVRSDEQGKVLGVSTSLTSITQIICPTIATALTGHDLLVAYGVTVGAFAALGAFLVMQPSDQQASPLPAEQSEEKA